MNELYSPWQSETYDHEQENLKLGENEQILDEAYESYDGASLQQLYSKGNKMVSATHSLRPTYTTLLSAEMLLWTGTNPLDGMGNPSAILNKILLPTNLPQIRPPLSPAVSNIVAYYHQSLHTSGHNPGTETMEDETCRECPCPPNLHSGSM